MLFTLAWLPGLPASHVEFTREMPEDALCCVACDGENYAVFVLFNTELFVFLVDFNSKNGVGSFGKREKVILVHFCCGSVRDLFNFEVSQVNLW